MGNGVIGWMVISQKRLKFGMKRDLTDFLNQRDRDYCIGMISSRW
jgi:hypothetical protein